MSRLGARPQFRRWRLRAGVFLGIAAVAAYARWVEPAWLEVTRHEVALGLRAPIRIAHLSDLHTRGLGRIERKVVSALEAERPDAIVVTGDVVADDGAPGESREVLARLSAPLGVFVVFGNWEYWRPELGSDASSGDAGVRWLRNQSVALRDDLRLVGLDDAVVGTPDAGRAFAGAASGAKTVAIFHSPALYDSIAARCDLALAGHTHGGQLRVPFLGAPWVPPGSGGYRMGWYSREKSRLYVNRGIGMSVVSFRFACRPEVAILDLR